MPKIKQKKDFRVLIVYPNLTMMLVPSLAIGIFTRILKGQGYEVSLFDTTHYVSDENSSPQNRVKFLQAREFDETNDLGVRIKRDLVGDFVKTVDKQEPDLILYSVVEDCYRQALALMSAIKDYNIPHLVGGVFPTAAPEVCIENDLIQMIGIGEGEQIIIDVAEAIRLNESVENIPGTWVKADGKIIRNTRAPVRPIDDFIPDFSLFDEARFNRPMGGKIFRTIPIETYRGCPFQCTYCNSPMQTKLSKESGIGSFLRRKDIKSLSDEIRQLISKYNPQFLYFIDDSFTARPKSEIFSFCDMYEEFGLPFWFNTRPETTTPEMMKRLHEVGAYRISFGIEAGNEQYRRSVLRRNGTNSELRGKFDEIADSGIPFSLNLIIGMPGETRDLIMDTIYFSRTIKGFDTITVSIFTPYHGTVLRNVAVKNEWLDENYITKHTTSSSDLKMPKPYLSSRDIDGLMRVIPLYIYFGEEEWDNIRRAETPDDEGDRVLKYYSEIYKQDFLGENQDSDKNFADEAKGFGPSSKDLFRKDFKSPIRIEQDEMALLTM